MKRRVGVTREDLERKQGDQLIVVVVIFQLLSCVQSFVTPWTAACQAPLIFTISQEFAQIYIY